jgi:hypothetical protein
MADLPVNISLNPFEWFDNSAEKIAEADRNLRSDQWERSFKEQIRTGERDYRWNQFTYFENRDRYNQQMDEYRNRLQTLVKDAKKAGIHPLAALGMSPSAPSGYIGGSRSSKGARGSAQAAGAVPANPSPISIMLGLDMMNKSKQNRLLETKIAAASKSNTSPEGQQPTTEYGPLKSEDVPVSKSYVNPGLGPSLKYQRGPDGTRIPVSEAEIEEIIAGWIIQQFGRYRSLKNTREGNTDHRYDFMSPSRRDSYFPDRQNRFNPDIDIAP